MKKINLPKINIKKIKIDQNTIFKAKVFLSKVLDVARNLVDSTKRIAMLRPVKIATLTVVIILSISQIVFAVLIYGFKSDANIVKAVSKVIPYPVATVGSDIVRYDEFLHERDYIHHFYQATEQTGVNFDEIDRQIVDQLIENEILRSQARRYKVKVDKNEVSEAVETIIQQNEGKENVEKVLNDLYGLNIDQFKKLIELQLLRENVNEQLIARVEASHILIRTEDQSEAKVTEAKNKILEISQKIKDGLDFAEAAREYSEDTGSASDGGKLGIFAKGDMVAEFSDMAFKTEVGKVSEPVLTEFGWHLIKVESKSGRIDQSFSEWIGGLKDKSVILRFYEV